MSLHHHFVWHWWKLDDWYLVLRQFGRNSKICHRPYHKWQSILVYCHPTSNCRYQNRRWIVYIPMVLLKFIVNQKFANKTQKYFTIKIHYNICNTSISRWNHLWLVEVLHPRMDCPHVGEINFNHIEKAFYSLKNHKNT